MQTKNNPGAFLFFQLPNFNSLPSLCSMTRHSHRFGPLSDAFLSNGRQPFLFTYMTSFLFRFIVKMSWHGSVRHGWSGNVVKGLFRHSEALSRQGVSSTFLHTVKAGYLIRSPPIDGPSASPVRVSPRRPGGYKLPSALSAVSSLFFFPFFPLQVQCPSLYSTSYHAYQAAVDQPYQFFLSKSLLTHRGLSSFF